MSAIHFSNCKAETVSSRHSSGRPPSSSAAFRRVLLYTLAATGASYHVVRTQTTLAALVNVRLVRSSGLFCVEKNDFHAGEKYRLGRHLFTLHPFPCRVRRGFQPFRERIESARDEAGPVKGSRINRRMPWRCQRAITGSDGAISHNRDRASSRWFIQVAPRSNPRRPKPTRQLD